MNTSFSSLNGCVEIFVMIGNHDDPQQSFFSMLIRNLRMATMTVKYLKVTMEKC